MKLLNSNFLGKRGQSIFLSSDLVLKYNIYHYGIYEKPTISFFRNTSLRSNEKYWFVDIGANCGLISRGVALNNEKISHIFAIEPVSENYSALIANLSATQTEMTVLRFALGNVTGNATLSIPRDQFGSAAVTSSDHIKSDAILRRVEIETPTNLIESHLNSSQRLLVKCDIENKDVEVLNSFPEIFWNRVDAVSFEIHKSTFESPSELQELLVKLDSAGLNFTYGKMRTLEIFQIIEFAAKLKQQSTNLMFSRE
jgi:FkbM family methyltransferase